MILFNLIKGSPLNPLNNGGFRDLINKPQSLLSDLESLILAKSYLRSLEKTLKEEKEKNSKFEPVRNDLSSDEIKSSMLESLELLSSLNTVKKVKKVYAKDITLTKIIMVCLENILNAIEYNQSEINIKEFSVFQEYRTEILSICEKLINDLFKNITDIIEYSKEDKKEIANFLNDFEDTADFIVKSLIKEDFNSILDKIELPKPIFKTIQTIINNIDKLDLDSIKKISEMFGVEINIEEILENFNKNTKSEENTKTFNFINVEVAKSKLISDFNLSEEVLNKLFETKHLSYISDGYVNEFGINGDRLIICNFIEESSGKVVFTRTMLFDEKGLVYEN